MARTRPTLATYTRQWLTYLVHPKFVPSLHITEMDISMIKFKQKNVHTVALAYWNHPNLQENQLLS